MKKEWIVIADAHLGTKKKDTERLADFIRSLDPKHQEIVILGDLFHVWAGPSKYHTGAVRLLLNELRRFSRLGGKTHFVVGNRDIFFLKGNTSTTVDLPFDTIAGNFLHLRMGKKKVSFIHGDTVNSRDWKYLCWRKIVRHPLFKALFELIPPLYAQKIMLVLERKLKRTNSEFRIFFPKQEWERFLARWGDDFRSDLLIVGHFHPEKPIFSQSKSTTGIVLPDWHTEPRYLKIDQNGTYRLMKHQTKSG